MTSNNHKLTFLSLGAALFSCYGLLAIVAVLGLFGLSLAIPNGLWSGLILLFSLITAGFITKQAMQKRQWINVYLAVVGLILLGFTFLVSYSLVTEILGFVLLARAAYLNYRSGNQ